MTLCVCGLLAGVVACLILLGKIIYGLLRNDPRLIQDEPDWMRELDNESRKGLKP